MWSLRPGLEPEEAQGQWIGGGDPAPGAHSVSLISLSGE